MVFEQEAAFETAIINLLVEKYGWDPEILRYRTEEDLIQNWKQILFENNRDVDRLNDVPLTNSEMQQILDQIVYLRTPLKLNGFINGKTISIKRDNSADELHFGKEVSLKIYDSQEIAAGQSRYQIAQQPVFKARSSVLPNRRGDFMLLIILRINGDFQLIRIDDEIYVTDVNVLERNLGFNELVFREASTSVEAIDELKLLEDIQVLKDSAEDVSFARKLSKVKKTSPIFANNIPKEIIVAFTKTNPGLKGAFKYSEDGQTIRLDTKKSKEAFIKLLNDAFLRSELTKEYYEARAKDSIPNS
jgi:hypothetical protein